MNLLPFSVSDLTTAKESANFLSKAITEQDCDKVVYLNFNTDAKPITSCQPDMEVFNAVYAEKPNQLYFFLGYPLTFLSVMYKKEEEEKAYLAAVQKLLGFLSRCHESMYSFHFAHKVAWGASHAALFTTLPAHKEMSTRIADFLLTLQSENGLFLSDAEAIDKYDQSAEIAQWLNLIAKNLDSL